MGWEDNRGDDIEAVFLLLLFFLKRRTEHFDATILLAHPAASFSFPILHVFWLILFFYFFSVLMDDRLNAPGRSVVRLRPSEIGILRSFTAAPHIARWC